MENRCLNQGSLRMKIPLSSKHSANSLVEYSLIISLVAVIAIICSQLLNTEINKNFENISTGLKIISQ